MSCFRDSTGPGAARRGHFAFAPVFDTRALRVVSFDRVRIRLVRPGTTQLALDTTVSFPPNADSILVPLTVPLEGSATSEDFDLTLAMINAAGDTVYRGGPTRVTAAVGTGTGGTPPVPIIYVGVGSGAAGVRFVTAATSVFFGDTAGFTAEAFDSANHAIPGTPILFGVDPRDTSLAFVPNPAVGRVVAKAKRGAARVTATLLTNQTATATLNVQPKAGALAITGGNTQTGVAGAALAQLLSVRVTGADGLGVQNVAVAFAVTAGGGALSAATVATNATGDAAVTWTLGPVAGANTATATVAGIAPVTFTATATPSTPAIQLILPGNAVGVGSTVPLGIKLTQAAPAGGTTVTITSDSTQYVTVAAPGTVAFAQGDTLKTINITGVAMGGSVLHATATGYTAGLTVVAVTPNLIVLGQNVTVAVGQTASVSIQLIPAAPTGGLTVTLASTDTTTVKVTTPTVVIPAGQSSGNATVQGVAAGVAGVTATAPSYATGGTVVTAGVAGQAALLTKVAGDLQTAAVGTAVPIPPAVKVTDVLGAKVVGRRSRSPSSRAAARSRAAAPSLIRAASPASAAGRWAPPRARTR